MWKVAITKAIRDSQFPVDMNDITSFLHYTLGEGRFGTNHWDLSTINRLYWWMKPWIPRVFIRNVRSIVNKGIRNNSHESWPIDDRYIRFLWGTISNLLQETGKSSILIKDFWPENKTYSLVLTHDVETPEAQSFIPTIADLEEKLGLRSSFNIVGNQFPKDRKMLAEIIKRGFEIGLHGWQHTAVPFHSRVSFNKNVILMNDNIARHGLVGHRSPLNLRHPEWMQLLEIDYDLSFFDSDPFEPIPGGTMSIWPFMLGKFLELPATLAQDNTLINFLGEKTPKIWDEKIEFIRKYHGMALLNSHPDYLIKPKVWSVYQQFLDGICSREDYWNALPRDVAIWWRSRTAQPQHVPAENNHYLRVRLTEDSIQLDSKWDD